MRRVFVYYMKKREYYWDNLTNFWHNNWRSTIDVVERLGYCGMVISAVGPVLRSAHLYGVVLKNDLQKTMLNSIPRTSLAEQQAENMYTISSSSCNMNSNYENLLHDQSDIKCTRIIWFTEIPWKTVGKGFFQIKSILLGKEASFHSWPRYSYAYKSSIM